MRTILFLITLFTAGEILTAQNRPFPQHVKYYKHIKPSQYSQKELDDQVKAFYNTWKSLYLKNGCDIDQYYVFFDSGNTLTVSEAMGYGMMILPLMAGYDPGAKTYFDGLFRFYKAHPSGLTPHLMAWKQVEGCVNADGDDSASDGDIDIAFGLLLAHEQWGSTGEINYLYYARLIIKDLMGETAKQGDINQDLHTVKLGDWVTSGDYMNSTRTSDFITDHFRAFSCIADDSVAWANVTNNCYDLVEHLQTNYSPNTGLLPDFIVDINTNPRPAPPNFLEGDLDGHYSYNACRDPWRLSTDYLINGEERAFNAVQKINNWIYNKTGGNPENIYAGYHLNGTATANWHDVSFTAPFAVGAMLDTTKQEWLNDLYDNILETGTAESGYYGNTLKLLSMLVISGNYWAPPCIPSTGIIRTKSQTGFKVYPTKTKDRIYIEMAPEYIHEKTHIKIYNLTGTPVLEQQITGTQKATLNISSLPAGIYILGLFSQKGNLIGSKKVVVSR